MACFTHNQLIELAIATAVNPQESDLPMTHLAACPQCSSYFAECMTLLKDLKHGVVDSELSPGAGSCLDECDIAAFADGAIAAENRPAFQKHLTRCAKCFGQVVELNQLLETEPKLSPPLVEFVIGIANAGLTLLKRPFQGYNQLQLQPVPLLGADDTAENARAMLSWTQEIESTEVKFTLLCTETPFVDLRIHVERGGMALEGGRITVRCGESIAQSEQLSSAGDVVLKHLHPVSYDLEISVPHEDPLHCAITLFPTLGEGTD